MKKQNSNVNYCETIKKITKTNLRLKIYQQLQLKQIPGDIQ